jgi:hypothetical protein
VVLGSRWMVGWWEAGDGDLGMFDGLGKVAGEEVGDWWGSRMTDMIKPITHSLCSLFHLNNNNNSVRKRGFFVPASQNPCAS